MSIKELRATMAESGVSDMGPIVEILEETAKKIAGGWCPSYCRSVDGEFCHADDEGVSLVSIAGAILISGATDGQYAVICDLLQELIHPSTDWCSWEGNNGRTQGEVVKLVRSAQMLARSMVVA